jgi:putative cardiolipin synthase
MIARPGRGGPALPSAAFTLVAIVLASCSSLPPGADYPRTPSVALGDPEQTSLGNRFALAARTHDGNSAYRIISVGVDGFLIRAQMIAMAERTLDLQYYIFRGDETGRLLTEALLRAADRGVRVRVLVDDGDTKPGDEQLMALDGHPNIQVRIFNPFAYRGHHQLLRTAEFLLHKSRLDYRMHNKLIVADNAVALMGGRNIGNQYFQLDPESQFADDDVFAAGPIAVQLSARFDEFWNNALAIPGAALQRRLGAQSELKEHRRKERANPGQQLATLRTDGIDYLKLVATGEPYAGLLSGRLPLAWAHAAVVADSPDKKRVVNGDIAGRLISRPVIAAAGAVRGELLMVTPYFVPTTEELQVLKNLRARGLTVRILTNSLESAPDLVAQSGYLRFRKPLLADGAELYEVRSLLGSARGSGQTTTVSRYGNYGLHAKLYVFDREQLFIGSMNFDQRSLRLNTETGLIIDSPELAQQTALRFDAMTRPENSYALALAPVGTGHHQHLVWRTQEAGQSVVYTQEPARSAWQRFKLRLLSWLPLGREL